MPSSSEVVVVTGAGGGIGQALSLSLLGNGYQVLAADVSSSGLASLTTLAGETRINLQTSEGDTSEEKVVLELFAKASSMGQVRGAVLAAGVTIRASFMETSCDDFQYLIRANLLNTFLCLRQAGKVLIDQKTGGSLVVMSSINGIRALHQQSGYSAAKAGMESLVRSASDDLGRYGIRVNSLAPGAVISPMNPGMLPGSSLDENIAMRRLAYPEDLNGAIQFLLSDTSSYVTGSTLVIDGGLINTR